jgi:hypothetical protein
MFIRLRVLARLLLKYILRAWESPELIINVPMLRTSLISNGQAFFHSHPIEVE